MDLKTYLKTLTPEAREQFAVKAETKPSYLPHIAGGHRRPSGELAMRIHLASGRKVSLSSMRPDLWRPQ